MQAILGLLGLIWLATIVGVIIGLLLSRLYITDPLAKSRNSWKNKCVKLRDELFVEKRIASNKDRSDDEQIPFDIFISPDDKACIQPTKFKLPEPKTFDPVYDKDWKDVTKKDLL